METALMVMAMAMTVQTLLLIGASIAAWVAWRKTNRALEEAQTGLAAQVVHLRLHLERISGAVDEVVSSVRRSSTAVGDVASDVREAMDTVRHSLGSVAGVVLAPRAALAVGLWRGLALWRRRRAAQRLAAAGSRIS